jgi:signal transduction histidine kinase/ligand-binding sensor domain-containing protein/CheY-like chemotaxis protein
MGKNELPSCGITRKYLLALLMALQAITCGWALDRSKPLSEYVHTTWRPEGGFPVDTVLALLQTHDGYLWAGTTEGLTRFNGSEFRVFNQANTPELKKNYIKCLFEDSSGNLWIGTSGGGLTLYREGRFHTYTTQDGLSNNSVDAITEDREGTLWVATRDGLNRFRKGTLVRGDLPEFAHLRIGDMTRDPQGHIWFVANRTLKMLQDGVLTDAPLSALPKDLDLSAIYADRFNNLWLGTETHGVFRMSGGKVVRYDSRQGLPKSPINVLYGDRKGNLWVGTGAAGLCRLVQERFDCYSAKQGLTNDFVLSIYEDREDALWVGGAAGGLNRFKDGAITPLAANVGLVGEVAWSVAEGRDGSLWVAMDSGLKRFKNGEVTAYTTSKGPGNNYVVSVWEDTEGNVWAGTQAGLNEFVGGQLNRLRTFTLKDGLVGGQITVIHPDHAGGMWFGSRTGGISRLVNGKFQNYTAANGLSSNRIWVIYEDHKGAMWFGTDDGLTRFQNGTLTHFDVPLSAAGGPNRASVQAIYEDREHALWLGTYGAGLKRFKDGRFVTLGAANGVTVTYFGSIFEDATNNLWFSSDQGIHRINRIDLDAFVAGKVSTVLVKNFGTSDGMVIAQSVSGTQPAGWKSGDGRLFFACSKGVMLVDPEHTPFNSAPPPVVIEEGRVNEAGNIQQGSESPVGAGKLEFHFAALSFLAPEKLAFKYKLENFEDTWMDAGTRRVAFYTNIPPGRYRFRVIASNNDGIWNETGASLSFYLAPHFYQTFWFRSLLAIAGLALLAGAFRLRVSAIRKRAERLEGLVNRRTTELQNEIGEHKKTEEALARAKRAAEAATRAKSEFLASMSHEIRTPMNGVLGMAELVLSTDLNGEQRECLSLLKSSADSLLVIINDILDYSKIEAGKLILDPVVFNLPEVLEALVKMLTLPAHQKGLEILLDIGADVPEYITGDYNRLRQVLINLLSNAIKFTEQGEVVLGVRREAGTSTSSLLHFMVKDTGIGMPAERQKIIFEAFEQGDRSTTRHYGGTGLGLAISSRIVELMGGRIWVESEPGRGSTFHFMSQFLCAPPGQVEKAPVTIARPVASGAPRLKVLLAEDNLVNQRVAVAMLEKLGHEVTIALDGREALEKWSGGKFDLVLMDVEMPVMDGFEATKQIRNREKTAGIHTPIIAMTAHAMTGDDDRCLQAGMDDYIAKPVSRDKLQQKINATLGDTASAGTGK